MSLFNRCTECESISLSVIGSKWSESGELYEASVYKCNKCGNEFDEEEADYIRNDTEEFGDWP